ncbi:MAG TPA: hypothetical protein VNJ07_02915, partial [Chitinophagales bacterium]|nr:hypothetical protein [Chitinophagales bacterium]
MKTLHSPYPEPFPCCSLRRFSWKTFNSIILLLSLWLVSANIFGQTTLVNYDFNSGTSFATLNSNAVSGITSSATGSAFATTTSGTTTGSNAFTANATAGNALSGGKSSNWTFTLTGTAISCYSSFKIYFQGRKSAAGDANNSFNVTYSLNGGSFVNTGITPA